MQLIEEHPDGVGHQLKEPRVRRSNPIDRCHRFAVVGGTLSLWARQAVVFPGAEQTHPWGCKAGHGAACGPSMRL
jgi:hypothetical protein